ncbi:hypothetical protein P9112_014658 [Eukaryota sp. TZLM1-RC]
MSTRRTRSSRSRPLLTEVSLDDLDSRSRKRTSSTLDVDQKRILSEKRREASRLKEEQERQAVVSKLIKGLQKGASDTKEAKNKVQAAETLIPSIRTTYSANGTTVSIPKELLSHEFFPSDSVSRLIVADRTCRCGSFGVYPHYANGSKIYSCSLRCFNSI